MKHEEWQVLVSAYADGEVSPEERAQVEAHLAECRECTAALQDYRQMGRAVQALPQGAPSRDLWLRVQEGLHPRRGWSLWQRLLPVASAVTMLVVAITLIATLGPALRGNAPAQAPPPKSAPAVAPAPMSTAAPEMLRAAGSITSTGLTAQDEVRAPGTCPGSPTEAGVPCPGQTLALEVVTMAVRSDSALTTPRLRGTLYDPGGLPLAGITLVVSGTAGWQGNAITDPDGTFVLDLPELGTYRVVLALAGAEFKAAEEMGRDDQYGVGLRYNAGLWYNVDLPAVGSCLAIFDMELAAFPLGPHDEAILTLRAR